MTSKSSNLICSTVKVHQWTLPRTQPGKKNIGLNDTHFLFMSSRLVVLLYVLCTGSLNAIDVTSFISPNIDSFHPENCHRLQHSFNIVLGILEALKSTYVIPKSCKSQGKYN
jgi:hypothetical protein